MKTALLTGGSGYVGTHTVVELLLNNWNVVIVDTLENSTLKPLEIIQKKLNKKVFFL